MGLGSKRLAALLLPASGKPMTVEAFDRAARRRLPIAIAVSLIVNAIVFGAAGLVGHRFLQSIQIMRDTPHDVTIRRVFVRDLPGGGIQIVPDKPTPRASGSHDH